MVRLTFANYPCPHPDPIAQNNKPLRKSFMSSIKHLQTRKKIAKLTNFHRLLGPLYSPLRSTRVGLISADMSRHTNRPLITKPARFNLFHCMYFQKGGEADENLRIIVCITTFEFGSRRGAVNRTNGGSSGFIFCFL